MQEPQGPTPEQIAQVQANVAKMRAKGATEKDVEGYLAYETAGLTAPAAPTSPEAAAPESKLMGFGRSVAQHAMLNFGDELNDATGGRIGIDQKKQDLFAKNNKILNFLATIGGGAAAPLLAALAAPSLATATGAVALGGLAGLISGAGDQDPNDQSPGHMDSRGAHAAVGGAAGMAGAAAGNVVQAAAPAVGRALGGAAKDLASVEGVVHAAVNPHGLGAKVITNALKKAFLNKATPADKAAGLFQLTEQFGGHHIPIFGGKMPVAPKFPAGGITGAPAPEAAHSMFTAPDEQY